MTLTSPMPCPLPPGNIATHSRPSPMAQPHPSMRSALVELTLLCHQAACSTLVTWELSHSCCLQSLSMSLPCVLVPSLSTCLSWGRSRSDDSLTCAQAVMHPCTLQGHTQYLLGCLPPHSILGSLAITLTASSQLLLCCSKSPRFTLLYLLCSASSFC